MAYCFPLYFSLHWSNNPGSLCHSPSFSPIDFVLIFFSTDSVLFPLYLTQPHFHFIIGSKSISSHRVISKDYQGGHLSHAPKKPRKHWMARCMGTDHTYAPHIHTHTYMHYYPNKSVSSHSGPLLAISLWIPVASRLKGIRIRTGKSSKYVLLTTEILSPTMVWPLNTQNNKSLILLTLYREDT